MCLGVGQDHPGLYGKTSAYLGGEGCPRAGGDRSGQQPDPCRGRRNFLHLAGHKAKYRASSPTFCTTPAVSHYYATVEPSKEDDFAFHMTPLRS